MTATNATLNRSALAPSRAMSKRRKASGRAAAAPSAPVTAAPAAATPVADVDAPKPVDVSSGRILGVLCVQTISLVFSLRVLPTITADVGLYLDLLSLLNPLIEAPLATILGTIVVMLPTQLFVGAQLRRWRSKDARPLLEPAVCRAVCRAS